MLEKSSTSYLGSRRREFESRHLDQKSTMVSIRNHRASSILIDIYTEI